MKINVTRPWTRTVDKFKNAKRQILAFLACGVPA